jgi:hypothetical protein
MPPDMPKKDDPEHGAKVGYTSPYDPWDEDIDDETGLPDPEYYAPPSWLKDAFHEVASESGEGEEEEHSAPAPAAAAPSIAPKV